MPVAGGIYAGQFCAPRMESIPQSRLREFYGALRGFRSRDRHRSLLICSPAKNNVEGAMQRRIAFAVCISVALASAGALAACPPSPAKPKTHPTKPPATPTTTKCVDFGAVPAISENIVAAEPAPKPKNPADRVGTPAPYTGPTVGLAAPGSKSVPTVGYRWSLE